MLQRLVREPDFAVLSRAVGEWYHYYQVAPDDETTDFLCASALAFFHDGYRTSDDIATLLIGTHIGEVATRVNARSSSAVH
ncbi:hypothetical protein [Rhizobium mongolense]|uniref:Uncharacterized protein n=1 Tax=Rhizobium mongolense TaxID=57676 RepID=A0A7W6RPL4_9HYPH|nr:hypothetical protein [Rhizobium mongolense]MBB4276194.1 hypothetical protein [Rhizobium mongolense]